MSMILLYHRVVELATDPQLLTVSPRHFVEHLQILREEWRPVPLADVVSHLGAGTDAGAQRSIAITFDDGYADNALTAAPALAGANVPATFFIATATLGADAEFYWDELERIALTPGDLPEKLAVDVGSVRFDASLGRHATYSPIDAEANRTWDVSNERDPSARQAAYRGLCSAFHHASCAQRLAALERLREWAGARQIARPTHRAMTREQLRQLASTEGVEVGAHTHHHPRLASESLESQEWEIRTSRLRLELWTGQPVRGFSYPFGTHDAYTPETVGLLREAGFDYACANFPRRIGPGTDPFRLPRFVVRDWPGGEFRQRLQEWMDAPIAY